ncbi:MAG TPA: GNAT family N-acetyltransferase [Acidimicrobiales bacterium]|jgi:GNAT superfamily N-acetyltransferase|nr:GNAT family N-acetyltransferase [Acidimicrobiales bacterium]
MELRQARLSDPIVAPLLAGLAAEYERRYGPVDEMSLAHPDEFDPPTGAFVVLIDGDQTVAGGGIRRLEHDTCEVKRMWTSPEYRRRGLATTVLAALEDAARQLGYTRVQLETGPSQPEAIAMYGHLGYRMIPPFGPYSEAVAFERDLAPADPRSAGATSI